jgi:hypothetical protein
MVSIAFRLLLVSWLLLGGSVALHGADVNDGPAGERGPDRRAVVRSVDPLIASLIAEGRARSSTFQQLLHALEGTDGIIYITPGTCPVSGMRGCLLHALSATDEARYLWIRVKIAEPPNELISVIGHELQHAVEVLRRPLIRSGLDMLKFYRSAQILDSLAVKIASDGRAFETHAAVAAGQAVRADLAATPAAGPLETDIR